MTLLYPIWLFLLIPLAVILWLWRLPSRLLLALRVVVFALVLLALCGLTLTLPSRVGTIVVVADRSESMTAKDLLAQEETIRVLQSHRGPEDRLMVVAFGQKAAVEPTEDNQFGGFQHTVGTEASNLAEALQTALALIPRDSPGKILVLSDGRWTGRDPSGVASWAAAQHIPIDYRPLEASTANDLAVVRLDAPTTIRPKEWFMLNAWIVVPTAQEVTYTLKRGKGEISAGKRSFSGGLHRLPFRDQAVAEAGHQAYELEIHGSRNDPVKQNNHARILVGIEGEKPFLHVVMSEKSGLAKLLKGGPKSVVKAPTECVWSVEELSKYSAVLLENVPADELGEEGMATLAAWVRETGSGLMFTGGEKSYGPGGYYRSPLEPIMPVSMELRNEHRKLALSIVVALDRSGSMAVSAGPGKTKMDLANQGTAKVLDLLGAQDEIGVLAVDTKPHVIGELGQVKDKGTLRSKILGIRSQGGGIYVDEALKAALEMQRKAKSGTRHVILFADTNDAEQPGNYVELLRQCKQEKITVSVIGLGKRDDKDSGLLRDIARRGDGRCYFTSKPEELPQLFADDAFVVSRNMFVKEETKIEETPNLRELTGRLFDLKKTLKGYNLCYLRPEATQSALTLDEFKAPVVASWQAGLGRVLCYTGEADGAYAGDVATWKDAGEYYSSLVRWTIGKTGDLPDKMLVTQEVKNGVNFVQLHLDPDRKGESFNGLPKVTILQGDAGEALLIAKAPMRWTGPDTLAVEIPLETRKTALVTVEVPGVRSLALPPVTLPYSPEFKPPEGNTGLPALQKLGKATGGHERLDVAGLWKELPRMPRRVAIEHWLLLAALVVFLLEILERRTGLLSRFRLPSWDRQKETKPRPRRTWSFAWLRVKKVTTEKTNLPAPPAPASKIEEAPKPAAKTEMEKSEGMLEALRQARRRTRR